jgi:hypothetical protein
MLAWPGDRFEVKPLSAFVPSGLMSNGTFAMHARSLFVRDIAAFQQTGGKPMVRFDYHVPHERSGYRIRSFGQSATVAYRGSFWADPQTLDVLRLEVHVDSIPVRLQMSKADTVIEYQRITIGAAEALLPKTAELTVTRRGGRQERNRISFSGCRQYGSESLITYGASNDTKLPAKLDVIADIPGVKLPPGLRLSLILETSLDAQQTAIGTSLEATVTNDVVDGDRVLIPRGAKVSGRVRQLRKIGKPVREIEIGLEFTQARWSGGQAQLAIGLQVDDGEPERIGILYVSGPEFRLSAGLQMGWKTLDAAAR